MRADSDEAVAAAELLGELWVRTLLFWIIFTDTPADMAYSTRRSFGW